MTSVSLVFWRVSTSALRFFILVLWRIALIDPFTDWPYLKLQVSQYPPRRNQGAECRSTSTHGWYPFDIPSVLLRPYLMIFRRWPSRTASSEARLFDMFSFLHQRWILNFLRTPRDEVCMLLLSISSCSDDRCPALIITIKNYALLRAESGKKI
jgi:hypothetical protein